jgi:hypothetical protein
LPQPVPYPGQVLALFVIAHELGLGKATIANDKHSETRHKTLEEIAAAFGDRVVEVGDREVEAEGNVLEEKAGARHVEKMEV